MPKTKSFIFISILSFVALFGLMAFLSRNTLAIGSYGDEEVCLVNGCDWDDVNNRCICPIVSPTRTPTATPSGTRTPAPTFTLPPETITPFPTPTPTPSSNLSDWCKKSYCGGCNQSECISTALLPQINMPINEVCEWRDNFCYTQMMSSDKIAKISHIQWSPRPVDAAINSDGSQYFWNNNYSVQRDRAWILAPSQVVTFTETGPKEYLCTNPQTPHETTCPPANPPLTKRDDSNANITSGVGRLWQSAVSFFKNNVISPLFGEKTLAKRSYSDQDSCVANGCDWIPNAQSDYPPYEFTGKCECPGICYVIPADCGFKTPWFIRDAETYTLNTDQPYSGDCGICKHLVNKNQVYIPTLIFKSTYTTGEGGGGGGGGGMLEEPMDEGGCQSIWDIINTDCSPLRLFKNTLEKSNVAHLFSPKAQAIKAYPDKESCEADNCDWISYSPSHAEGFCICPTISPAPDANCNIAGAENSVYSQLSGVPENYSLPSAGVTLKTVLAGSASKWSGQIRFWAERTFLKYFGVDKMQIHKGDKVTISWSVINPAYNKDNQPLIYLYSGPVPVIDPNHHIDIVKYDGGDPSTTTDDRYFVGELGTAGSVVAQPEEDTIFYLIVRGVTGEGMKDLVSDEIIVRVIDEENEGWVDLKVKGNAAGNDYTDGPIAIARGTDVALKWTSEENVDSCTASATPENAAWTGTVKTTGNKIIYGVTNSTIFKLDCTLKNGKAISDSATVNIGEDPNDPTRQGFIEVKARLINGTSTTEYTGPVKYAINGPQSFTGEAPQSFTVQPGQYVLTYVSGGPSEAVCITPSKAGVVESQKTLTFYLDFEVQNLCSINVNYQVPASAASWDRKASYVLIGPTILTGNSLPYSFTQIPPGVYYISYISGAPENLVFSGVLEGNGQVCYPKQPLQFTLQFTEPGATPPVPLPSPEIGNNPPTAKIGCAADDPVRCIGTIDGDPDTPTITLYNASTDPDKDITSCTWTIQKQGQGGESISKRTCQPVTIGDDTGSYTVTLRVTDSKNNTNETQITAQVKNVNELTPKFVWNPQIPTVGKTVNFYDRSLTPSGRSLKTWSWTFEDGSPATSTSPNPEVTFNSSGPKSVTLMVTDDLDNSSSTSKVIDVRNIAPQWREVIPK